MADEGLYGLSDFTGVPIGQPLEVPTALAGFFSLLDFTGIPYGVPSVTTGGGGFQGAGRRHLNHMLAVVARDRAAEQVLRERIRVQTLLRTLQFKAALDQQIEREIAGARDAVLLAIL